MREDEVRLPDGGQARREYVVHPGAAVILPIFDDWGILLERQFRYPPRDHFLELPAGKFDAGEKLFSGVSVSNPSAFSWR